MKKVILFAILICLVVQYINAIPANPKPREIKQPNGTSLTVRLIGDEYFHYITTSDGVVIEKNSAGNYEYVDIKADGTVGLSGVLANDEKNRTPWETDMVRQLREKQVKQKYIKYISTNRDEAFEIMQPDNTTLRIKRIESGNSSYTTTEDGLIIEKNENGFYEYLTFDKNNISLSGIAANDIERRGAKEKEFIKTLVDKKTNNVLTNRMAAPNRDTRGISTKGSKNALVILMEFPDKKMNYTKDDFYKQFNEKKYNGTGSVRDFFLENSYGQLSMHFTVVGPYMAKHNMAYYGQDNSDNNRDKNVSDLIDEAVHKANGDVDFSSFDADYDNIVDFVHIIYAGYSQSYIGSDPNTIWPHQGTMSWFWSIFHWLDGKMITKYSCSSELSWISGNGMKGIGTACHELGHILGAPDFYDRDGNTNGKFIGTGDWDLMASGGHNGGGKSPAHFNPFVKTQMFGWAPLKELPDAGNVVLSPASKSAGKWSFYKLPTQTPDEYFILENRQQQGFDKGLPGHGLMIYHVHSKMKNVKSTDGEWINIKHPQMFYPVCANATNNPHNPPHDYGDINTWSCPFPYKDENSFNAYTIPSAVAWDGKPTTKNISFIERKGDDISLIVNNPNIEGGDNILSCNEEIYTIKGLPEGSIVNWSFYAYNQVKPIYSSPNGIVFRIPLYGMYLNHNKTTTDHTVKFRRGFMINQTDILENIFNGNHNLPKARISNYEGDVKLIADIKFPDGSSIRVIKDKIYVSDLYQSIVIKDNNGNQVNEMALTTNTDYILTTLCVNNTAILNNSTFEWEFKKVLPQDEPKTKMNGRSINFRVNKNPNVPGEIHRIETRVRYINGSCSASKWFYKTLRLRDPFPYQQYSMIFSNPSSEVANVSVFRLENQINREQENSLYNTDQEGKVPYWGNYIIELWNEYTKLKSMYCSTPNIQIPLTGLLPGIYIIRLIISDNVIESKQLIVN